MMATTSKTVYDDSTWHELECIRCLETYHGYPDTIDWNGLFVDQARLEGRIVVRCSWYRAFELLYVR